jgi:SLAP domain-containing protein
LEQKLIFHKAWNKTICEQDRNEIIQMCLNTSVNDSKITFTPIRVAQNYQQNILATVLISNGTNETKSLTNLRIVYKENGKNIAENTYSVPMVLNAKESTPWTFIFPQDTVVKKALLKDWQITMV